jgi:hypothetical protein
LNVKRKAIRGYFFPVTQIGLAQGDELLIAEGELRRAQLGCLGVLKFPGLLVTENTCAAGWPVPAVHCAGASNREKPETSSSIRGICRIVQS